MGGGESIKRNKERDLFQWKSDESEKKEDNNNEGQLNELIVGREGQRRKTHIKGKREHNSRGKEDEKRVINQIKVFKK